jgi:hypothetical protein
MGKSRGGLSTKIHATVDALGNPVRLLLTPVRLPNSPSKHGLLFRRRHRKAPRDDKKALYKERNLVERAF